MKNQCFANCMGSALQKDIIFDKRIGLKRKKIAFYLNECSENQRFNKFIELLPHFLAPGSGSVSGFRIRIQGPDWIRIQSGSGSETLRITTLMYRFFCRPFHFPVRKARTSVKFILCCPIGYRCVRPAAGEAAKASKEHTGDARQPRHSSGCNWAHLR